MTHHFSELEGFEDRHAPEELEACAAALFLAHGDVGHYDDCVADLRRRRTARSL